MGRAATRLSLDRGELVSAGFAVALLVLVFAFAWYGVDGLPTRAGGRAAWSENGWHALRVVRWLILVTSAACLGSLAIHWRQRRHGARTSTAPALAALGLLTSLALIYRVLIALPSAAEVPDQKLGAVLAVFAALGIAVGSWDSVRAARGS